MRINKLRKRLKNDLPIRHFYIVETLLKSSAENDYRPVSAQNLIDRLSNSSIWSFFKDQSGKLYSKNFLEDIAYLHQRGFAYVKGNGSVSSTLESRDEEVIFPTYQSGEIFREVYKKAPHKVNWKRRKVRKLE